MKSTLQRLIESEQPLLPPWGSTDPLALMNYNVVIQFLVFSILSRAATSQQESLQLSKQEKWPGELRDGRLTQARRRQVLRAYLHECERDRKRHSESVDARDRDRGEPTPAATDLRVVGRWIEVFETSQPASALDRYFADRLGKIENSSHPAHRDLKKHFPSDRTFPLLASRSWIAAVRHWAGNTTAGFGRVHGNCQDPWLEQVLADLAVKEVGQHVVPCMLWISELERLRCPAEHIYTRTTGDLFFPAGSIVHKAKQMIDKLPTLPKEVQAILASFNSLTKGPSRTRFVAEKSDVSIVKFFPGTCPSVDPTYWFEEGKLCFRVPDNLRPIPAWIESYVVDHEGNQLNAALSETDDVYTIEVDPFESGQRLVESRVRWVGMTALDGGINQAIIVIVDPTHD